MTGCASSTSIIASWNDSDIKNGDYSNILVTAMVDNIKVQKSLEDELAEELNDKRVKANKSLNIFPPELSDENMRSKEELLAAIEENGFDGIITVALIDKESEARYVAGSYPYAPLNNYGYYGTFWGYYNYWYPQMYNTGYYDINKTYFLETNFYDAESEKLVWSAQSKTVNPTSLKDLTQDFSKKIINSIENQTLIKSKDKKQ
jgi:hypothetical protein